MNKLNKFQGSKVNIFYVFSQGQDSLDDNFMAIVSQNMQETLKGTAKLFNQTNDLNRHFNVYNQIDKLTNNAQLLARKLETTEL